MVERMKTLHRLAFALTVASSATAYGIEPLEDEALGAMTGQDGITVSYTPAVGGVSFSTILHDADAWAAGTNPAYAAGQGAGAIILGNPLGVGGYTATSIVTPAGQSITAVIDATGDFNVAAGSQAAIMINISIPANTVINTGSISVAQSNGLGNAVTNQTSAIMDSIAITLGATSLVVTLGNEAAGGQMMQFATSMAAGLNIANFVLRDANGGGTGGSGFRASSIQLDNAGASNALDVDFRIDLAPSGLTTSVVTMGTGGADLKIAGLRLGDSTAPAIGNVDVVGLNMNGAIVTISGH